MAKKAASTSIGSNFFRDLMEKVEDDDLSLMADGLGSAEFTGYMDTGCYTLNALVSGTVFGGLPNNSATALIGDPATGKTFILLGILKYFLKANPEAGAIFYEIESAVRRDMMTARDIDVDRVLRSEPRTIEEFRNKAANFIGMIGETKEPPPFLMLLDSLGALSSNKEISDMMAGEEKRDMSKAGLIKGAFRVLRPMLARARIPLLLTNHFYAGVGMYMPPKIISGGSGLIYAADTLITLAKKKITSSDVVIGNLITAKTYKARLARENQEVEMMLTYEKGLDRYHGLREIAENAGVFEKAGNQILLPGGVKVYGKEIEENPEQVYIGDVMGAVDEACKKMFRYGVA